MPIFKERGIKLWLLVAVLLPSLIKLKFETSSMAAGLVAAELLMLLAALVFISFKPRFFLLRPALFSISFILCLISLHYFISGMFVSLPQDGLRFIGTLIAFALLIIAAAILASSLVLCNQGAVRRIISCVMIVLVVNGILSLTGIDYLGTGTQKAAFLFSEPSHFALITAPFLIYSVRSRCRGWAFFLLVFFCYAAFLENLTMLIVAFLATIVGIRAGKLLLLIPALIVLFVLFVDTNYFFDRLVFSIDEANVSGLVFLQGWQNAYLAFLDTDGWGVGFQQFGIASPTGDVTERIRALNGNLDLNLFDGGSTASKLLGEFGLFGAIIDMMFIVRAVQALWILKRVEYLPDLTLFAKCVEIGILIELFIRGVGYFSPGIFIYCVMYFVQRGNRNSKISAAVTGMKHGHHVHLIK